MMSYKRGDVVLVRFPNSDLTTYKKRPALVIQSDDLKTEIHQKIVALITSNPKRAIEGLPSRIAVIKDSTLGQEMGILSDSVIVLDNLATILERTIERTIGSSTSLSGPIDDGLRTTLKI